VGDGERRVAIVENKRLDDYYIELDRHRSTLGNIYKGKVESILPSINGAFVNIGQEKNGFLYLTDADHPYVQDFDNLNGPGTAAQSFFDKLLNRKPAPRPEVAEAAPLNGQDTPKTDVPVAALPASSGVQQPKPDGGREFNQQRGHGRGRSGRGGAQGQQGKKDRPCPLKTGQEVLVQVEKDPFGTKGARLTTHLSIPGRFVVYMPYDKHIGVSQKIESPEERQRLRDIIRACDFVKDGGFIVRTVSQGQDKEELLNDARFVYDKWQKVVKLAKEKKAPAILYQEGDIIWKVVRDFFRKELTAVHIDSKEEHEKLTKYVDALVGKAGLKKVHYYGGEQSIFEAHKVSAELERIYDQKVFLKTGAHIVIEPTEGVTVIDVNSGRYKTSASPEDAAFNVNIEAAPEIARQLRLRDLGGIIVIDFIDMSREDHKRKVLDVLRAELARDLAKTEVNKISSLGLVEMTRERAGKTIESLKFAECPYCHGRGRMRID